MKPTPFALLDPMVKAANTQPYPSATLYEPGSGGVPAGSPGSPGNIQHPGVVDNFLGDMAMSAMPFGVGSVYQYNKALGDIRNGRWGSALGNAAWGTLSLIPGVGSLRGLFSGLRGAAKGVGVLGKAKAGYQGTKAGLSEGGKKMWNMLPGKSAPPGARWSTIPGAAAKAKAIGTKVGVPWLAGSVAENTLDKAPSVADPNALPEPPAPYDPYAESAKYIDSLGLPK